ncbi:putative casein kinase II subunit beta-2 [Choanephora cucurbitarum]|uniref:Casein kinase II subunit beta n=1 Tax=Choanephora cucurbitarum TaxID=101091 RepID=A0A1C7NJS3_9FUNG|nr:putative casein kinase II subunit beta-2 [Choanephora cucurbitarum]
MDQLFSTNSIEYEEDGQSNTDGSLQSWISWFCSLSGHGYYIEVPEDFIEDEFNLTGLSSMVPYYTEALEMILDIESEKHDWIDPNVIEPYAAMLYGLIHSRYLLTRPALHWMAERFRKKEFGVCPRYFCEQSPVIPCGRYDELARESVRLYCPRCLDLYCPPMLFQSIDGSHFGTTYAHLLFETYAELIPKSSLTVYQPRIFGFRVNEQSIVGPRMQWLRMYKEEEEDELI